MSGRTFPKKNSGKMTRERRYGRGGRDEESDNDYYDGSQAYRLGGQNRGGGGERREERSGWNRAGRDSEDRPSTHRQRGPRYGDFSRRSHRKERNAEDRDLGDRRRDDRDRGYGRNGGNVSRYDRDMNGGRGIRRIQHEMNQRAMEGPKVQRLKAKVEEMEKERAFYMYGAVSGNRVAYNLRPPRQQSPPPPRRQPPPAPASAAPVPRRGKTIILEARDYSDEDDEDLTKETQKKPSDALAKLREEAIRKMKEAFTPPGSPPPFKKDDE